MGNDIDEVSLTLGELRGELKMIGGQVTEGNRSRRELHEKVNTVVNSMAEMSAKVQSLCSTVETLAETVRTHEELKQQGAGMKTLVVGAFSACGTLGIFEAAKHLFFKG